MSRPYQFRIMACLPGHAPVELFRSKAKYNPSYWRSYAQELDGAWLRWVEHRLPDNHCMTDRHDFAR